VKQNIFAVNRITHPLAHPSDSGWDTRYVHFAVWQGQMALCYWLREIRHCKM